MGTKVQWRWMQDPRAFGPLPLDDLVRPTRMLRSGCELLPMP